MPSEVPEPLTPSAKAPRKRVRRTPADLAVQQIVRLPLGELARVAEKLAREEPATASYLVEKLESHLPAAGGLREV